MSMKDYTIYIHRYGQRERQVLYAQLRDDARAREFAGQRLAASPEHAAIEVWDGAAQLCCLSAEPIELPAAA